MKVKCLKQGQWEGYYTPICTSKLINIISIINDFSVSYTVIIIYNLKKSIFFQVYDINKKKYFFIGMDLYIYLIKENFMPKLYLKINILIILINKFKYFKILIDLYLRKKMRISGILSTRSHTW